MQISAESVLEGFSKASVKLLKQMRRDTVTLAPHPVRDIGNIRAPPCQDQFCARVVQLRNGIPFLADFLESCVD